MFTESRSAVTERIQEQRLGNLTHTAGDVQLPASSHPTTLPHTTAESAAYAGAGSANQPVPASSLVGLHLPAH